MINVVGIGLGTIDCMTTKALKAIEKADIIIGYVKYINKIKNIFPDKIFESNGMKKEVERCKRCIELAKTGKNVCIVSSGDSGIYGMAGLIIEMTPPDIEVNVISGITTCIEAANILGSPLMNDFVVVSMSDLMTPYDKILKRIEAACIGDFVICIYNPRSSTRTKNIEEAFNIIIKMKDKKTIVGIVKNAGCDNEEHFLTTVSEMKFDNIDMNTIVVVGNSDTIICNGKMVTKRGYNIYE